VAIGLPAYLHFCKLVRSPPVTWQWRRNEFTLDCSDCVTRINHSTRVTIFHDSDATRVTLRKMVTRLGSTHVFHGMTRLESQSMTRDSSQSHFYKISEFLMDKPSSFAYKEMRIFCFSDDPIFICIFFRRNYTVVHLFLIKYIKRF